MRSKSWPNGFARACATTSLLAIAAAAQPAVPPAAQQAAKPPAVVLVDPAEAAQWESLSHAAGWRVIAPEAAPAANPDRRALAIAARVEAAIAQGEVDPRHIYLAGRGDSAAMVFYVISRVPDLWAAGVALGGSPKPAIDSNRIYAANFTLVPVLWAGPEDGKELADKLKAAGLNLEFRPTGPGGSVTGVVEWLAAHHRDAVPSEIDCETNSPEFARCYWIQMTKFDSAERNDVLPATRIPGGSGAALDLGGFGFKLDDPGPGLLVGYLPEKYSGPLKLNDRIMALDGRPLANAKQYQALLEKVTEEKQVVAMVQRGKDRIRVETRIVLPRRDPGVTARVQGRYLPAEKEIQIVSRTATAMRVTVPPEWLPAGLLWNGLTLESIGGAGCWQLSMEKELLRAEKCP